MKEVQLLSWNVNSIRSVKKKGFLEWLGRASPDILCLQETKAQPEQLDDDLKQPDGYQTYWNAPKERKGYAGVATFTKEKPRQVRYGFGIEKFDVEGRVIITDYPGFSLYNIYFPNGKASPERLQFKMDFYDAFLDFVEPLRKKGDKLVICGDVNTAHTAIDLARPKANEKLSGFLPSERAWLDKFLSRGFVDTFRHFNKEPANYSWWDIKTGARERNVGWRIDYFYISENLLPSLKSAFILTEVMGSETARWESRWKCDGPFSGDTTIGAGHMIKVTRVPILLLHAFVLWGLCGATVAIGRPLIGLQLTLIVHAVAAPLFAIVITLFYFRRFGHATPRQTAFAFLLFVIALDAALVAPVFERSYDMFRSIIGTWLPFLLIFAATWTTGYLAVKKSKRSLIQT